jgi:hypothetical protein
VVVAGICSYSAVEQVVKVEQTLFEVALGARDSYSSAVQTSSAPQRVFEEKVAGAPTNSLAEQVEMASQTRLAVMVGGEDSKVSPTTQYVMMAHSTSLVEVGAVVWYWLGKSQVLKSSQIRSEVSEASVCSY